MNADSSVDALQPTIPTEHASGAMGCSVRVLGSLVVLSLPLQQ